MKVYWASRNDSQVIEEDVTIKVMGSTRCGEVGEDVFLTKEEANAALAFMLEQRLAELEQRVADTKVALASSRGFGGPVE